MANAYACDRCGNLFRKEGFADSVPVILENGDLFNIAFGNLNTYIVTLCPKCRAGFQKWWDESAYYRTIDHQGAKTLYEEDERRTNYD